MIALSNSDEFYEKLIANIHKKQQRPDCVDFALETTDAVFDIGDGDETITYRHDFSYYFGLQIAALKRLREAGGEEVLVSPFGDKIHMTASSLEISNSNRSLTVADGKKGLDSYFLDMLQLLKGAESSLDKHGLTSRSIQEFIGDINILSGG